MGTKRHGKKSHRQALKRTARNRSVKSATKTAIKKALLAVDRPPEERAALLCAAYRAIDVAARKGVLHKRAAARKKSRVAKRLNKVTAV